MIKIDELWKGYRLEGSKDECVFLIHGFSGTAAELYPVGKYLSLRGYSIVAPQIVGHTRSMEDLKKTDYRDWLESVQGEYRKIRAEFPKVYVLGISMGGALACILEETEKDKPDALVLYEPCLVIKNPFAYLAGFISLFVKKISWEPMNLPYDNSQYIQNPRGYYTIELKSLAKLAKLAMKNIKEVKCPFQCYYSLKDELISFRGIKALFKKSSSKDKNVYLLSDSKHMINVLDDSPKVFLNTYRYLQSLKIKK